MPPRLQCLNQIRFLKQKDVLSKAAFSTTARSLADTRPSQAIDLLASISDPAPYGDHSRRGSVSTTNRSSIRQDLSSNPSNSNANHRVMNLIRQASRRGQPKSQVDTIQELKNHKLASDLSKQITRRWREGDIYAPHDLSSAEMGKWRRRKQPETDVLDVLDMNPIEEYKNFSIMSEFMTMMGRIKPGSETGLRKRNQRRMAKAIRRSIGLGLMPSVHRHPEILFKEGQRAREQAHKFR